MAGAIVLIVGVVAVALGWFIIGYLASFVSHHVSVWFVGFQERRKKLHDLQKTLTL